MSTDLIIIGGGVSTTPEHFLPLLRTRTPIVPARLGNDAGISGAALLAFEQGPTSSQQVGKAHALAVTEATRT